MRQVAEHDVGQCAEAEDEGVAAEQATRAPGDRVDRPAAHGDEDQPDRDGNGEGRAGEQEYAREMLGLTGHQIAEKIIHALH